MEIKTYIYLIRHSQQLKIQNNEEDSQIANEKIILSVEGENRARKLAEIEELQGIDVLWSSNYTRAIATAKYIAYKNNIEINISKSFGERKLGDLEELKRLGETKNNKYTVEQMLDENLKIKNGESRKEVTKRMEENLNEILEANIGKKIAIVSHGAAIKFLLMNWCKLNSNNELMYNDQKLELDSPGVIKLTYGEELENIQRIV